MVRLDMRLILVTACVMLALPQRVRADAASCTEAHASGQRHENSGLLKEALQAFQECASDAKCPLPIRNECTQLYTTVEGRLPTLVFSIVDENGNDLIDVEVTSAGALVQKGLDGRPVAVNPGLHDFRFQLPSGEVLSKSIVVRQGEKDRIVALRLPRTDFSSTHPAQTRSELLLSPVDEPPKKRWTLPLGSWISYGVGVAALGAWGTFALLGRNAEKGLIECSPDCDETRRSDYDAMKRDYLIADISLGVAGAAAIAGTVVLLTMGRDPKVRSERVVARRPRLSLSPVAMGREGGLLKLEGRY